MPPPGSHLELKSGDTLIPSSGLLFRILALRMGWVLVTGNVVYKLRFYCQGGLKYPMHRFFNDFNTQIKEQKLIKFCFFVSGHYTFSGFHVAFFI